MALEARLVQATDRGLGLEQQVADADTARQEAERRHARELADAAAQLDSLQARYDAALAESAAARVAFERQTAEAASALERVNRERLEDAAAAAGQIAGIEAKLGARLAEAADARTALERTLADAQSAQQKTVEDLASAAAREVALEDRLAKETDRGVDLARQLAAADTARQEAERRHTSELADAAVQLASLQTRYDASLAESTAARVAFEQQAAEAAVARTALEHTLADVQSAQQRTVEHLASAAARQAELEDRLAQATARGLGLERQVSDADTARQQAERRHTTELAHAAVQLDSVQARYDAALGESAAARVAFEQQTAEAAVARTALEHTLADAQSAQQKTVEDLASAAAREVALEDRLAKETDRGLGLERQLAVADTARQDAERRHASELAEAAAQLASLQARFDTAGTEHAAAQVALEQRLTDAATAYQQMEDRTAAAIAVASARQAELVERLTQECDARAALERDLTAVRMESARGRDRSRQVISNYRRHAREQKVQFETELSGERTHADRRLQAKEDELRQVQQQVDALQHLLGTTQHELQDLHGTVEAERLAHERARLTSESELLRISAEYGHSRQSFDRLQSAFQTLEQVAGEHAAERGKLEAVVADRDRQLSAQTERHRTAELHAHQALAELQETLRQALETGASETARLQQEIDTVHWELDATRTSAEALRSVAERVPDLQTQLERRENEGRRQFERAPYALCRCSQSGEITDANHSFVTLLGCRRVDELRDMNFVSAALDSAGDLGWLLERAQTTRRTETVETHWKTWDGRRLVVRLQALATTAGSIDIVVEDITDVRALEERLRQAQRMEAVGRLASEVALTCDALLSDVSLGAHEWLAMVDGDDTLRRHAERLLTDVTRAASFLRQLGTYGNEQVRALEPVSAQRVLRDLAPVLKRLVGDQIELVLPKSAGAFNVEVDAERLERVFINVAGYARERMSSGGQVRIELATTAVGRRFVARYSNVRPGDHVLVTVTEMPAVRAFRGDTVQSSRPAEKPGVDLGVLVDLIASCGGHLWLEAQPAGNMVVKIHLPKHPAADATGHRGGRASKWFRSASAANVHA